MEKEEFLLVSLSMSKILKGNCLREPSRSRVYLYHWMKGCLTLRGIQEKSETRGENLDTCVRHS